MVRCQSKKLLYRQKIKKQTEKVFLIRFLRSPLRRVSGFGKELEQKPGYPDLFPRRDFVTIEQFMRSLFQNYY
ncbi:hypothetical protein PM8797T_08934 [Gimesia maris DSM 8797]|nr:hypothetical protein PM8797T_08934 [Gimesia maris DSM 8797]